MKPNRCVVSFAGLLLGVALSVDIASAQRGGGTGGGQTGGGQPGGGAGGNTGGNAGGNIPTPGTPGRSTTPGTATPTQPDYTQMQRGFFLSGKVTLDDGTAPPDIVVIERVCGAMRRPEAYTDSKGRFSFQLGQNTAQMLPDASLGSADLDPFSGRGQTFGGTATSSSGKAGAGAAALGSDPRLMGCELRAVLTGYSSESVNLSGRRMMDSPDVGTILLHRLGNVQGNTISATSLEAPKDAKKAYEKGMDAMKKQKWADAQKQFEKAVEVYPRYAAAWNELGMAYLRQNNAEQAQNAFSKALEADPKYLKPYLPLAQIAMQQRKWQDVSDLTDKLIRLDPVDIPQAFLWNAIANSSLRKLDVAEQSVRELIKIDTASRYPYAQYVLGVTLANKGDYAGALSAMKTYLEKAPDAANVDAVRNQIAQLEKEAAAQAPKPQ